MSEHIEAAERERNVAVERMRIAEDKADDFKRQAEADAAEFTRRENECRSLLDTTEFALAWFFDHFDDPKYFKCDCAEDDGHSGGYMEWDTNSFIHAERCSSGMDDTLAALRDQIRQVLERRHPSYEAAEREEE